MVENLSRRSAFGLEITLSLFLLAFLAGLELSAWYLLEDQQWFLLEDAVNRRVNYLMLAGLLAILTVGFLARTVRSIRDHRTKLFDLAEDPQELRHAHTNLALLSITAYSLVNTVIATLWWQGVEIDRVLATGLAVGASAALALLRIGAAFQGVMRREAPSAPGRFVEVPAEDSRAPELSQAGLLQVDPHNPPAVTVKAMARPKCVEEVPNPGVAFRDVIGMQHAKTDLAEAIRLIEHPEKAQAHGVKPIRGIILHGPPGTGKTFFAKAAAGEFQKNFLSVRASELVSKYVGETEKNLKAVFDYARSKAPAILFFDEFDAIAPDRRHVAENTQHQLATVNALLAELDGITKDERAPIVIAATNYLERIDGAMLRPGRFDRKVLVDLPDRATRLELLKMYLKGRRLAGDVDLAAVAAATDGFSPADLKALTEDVARMIYRENPDAPPRAVTRRDLHTAMQARTPSAI